MYSIGLDERNVFYHYKDVKKSDVIIHPNYLEGIITENGSEWIPWVNQTYKLYDLALIATKEVTVRGTIDIKPVKRASNR